MIEDEYCDEEFVEIITEIENNRNKIQIEASDEDESDASTSEISELLNTELGIDLTKEDEWWHLISDEYDKEKKTKTKQTDEDADEYEQDQLRRIYDVSASEQGTHFMCKDFDGTHNMHRAKCVSASEIGAFAGLSKYDTPIEAWQYKMKFISKDFSAACEHGHRFEEESLAMLTNLLRRADFRAKYTEGNYQKFDKYPGYDKPRRGFNEVFKDKIDCNNNGCSLDGRGRWIDAEIKNPTSFWSFWRCYAQIPMCITYCQCQHIMAVRGREVMLLYCTSFVQQDLSKEFNAQPKILMGEVLWEVRRSREFYDKYLRKPGRVVAEALSKYAGLDKMYVPQYLSGLDQSPGIKKRLVEFQKSDTWKAIIDATCTVVYKNIDWAVVRQHTDFGSSSSSGYSSNSAASSSNEVASFPDDADFNMSSSSSSSSTSSYHSPSPSSKTPTRQPAHRIFSASSPLFRDSPQFEASAYKKQTHIIPTTPTKSTPNTSTSPPIFNAKRERQDECQTHQGWIKRK